MIYFGLEIVKDLLGFEEFKGVGLLDSVILVLFMVLMFNDELVLIEDEDLFEDEGLFDDEID